MLHGIMMSFSWYQMAGRLMVTNPFHFNGCWTYPAYKTEVITEKVFAVDSLSNPPFPMEEKAFLALITVPTVIVILLVAIFSTYWYHKIDRKSLKAGSDSTLSDGLAV